jgi:hypothetical protein
MQLELPILPKEALIIGMALGRQQERGHIEDPRTVSLLSLTSV